MTRSNPDYRESMFLGSQDLGGRTYRSAVPHLAVDSRTRLPRKERYRKLLRSVAKPPSTTEAHRALLPRQRDADSAEEGFSEAERLGSIFRGLALVTHSVSPQRQGSHSHVRYPINLGRHLVSDGCR